MELSYKGGNCVQIDVKKVTVVIDGRLSAIGLKDISPHDAVQIGTQPEFVPTSHDGVVVDGPGEYEVKGISIGGIVARRMIDADNMRRATIYYLSIDGVKIAVVGHITFDLSDDQLESIGVVDIAIVPVGGGGYTLDGHQATNIIKQLGPKVVIPTHYADSGVNYEVAQDELAPFIAELGAPTEKVDRYKIKNSVLPEALTVVEITRS